MNNPELLEFFRGPVAAAIGTVGRDGKPAFLRVLGVHGTEGSRRLRAVVSREIAKETFADLQENNLGSLTVADVTTMQSKQFKGKATVEDATAADAAAAEASMAVSAVPIGAFFGPGAKQGWERMLFPPYATIVIDYTSRFNQTPGPDAGKELS